MIDGRTRKGYEQSVLNQVRKEGGFSVFWVTACQARAHAAHRLIKRGVIERYKSGYLPDRYPWHSMRISK